MSERALLPCAVEVAAELLALGFGMWPVSSNVTPLSILTLVSAVVGRGRASVF